MIEEIKLETFPQLQTRNLMLRRLVPADAEAVFRLFADAAVTQYYDLETFTTLEQATQLIQRQTDRFEQQAGIRWGIALPGDNIIIGSCGYVFDKPHAQAGLGYELSQAFWRRGFMTEALAAILRFGFERLALNRIQALVMRDNRASVQLLHKLGFQEEGILRESKFFKGQFHDLRCFSLLKKDYSSEAVSRPTD
ncbi:MAG: GNAT family N-acetyltransferase [Anaerolineae bacterium]|nr:GNAT family N-acetyltransferase [Anaerolineae bacterium]